MTRTRAEWSAAPALWTLAVLATVFFLRAASLLLIPIVIGFLLSYALEPVVAWLERHRVPRLAGASLVLVTILGLLGWGTYTLRDDFVEATEALPTAVRRAREFLTKQSESGPPAHIAEAVRELRQPSTGQTDDTRSAAGTAGVRGADQSQPAAESPPSPAADSRATDAQAGGSPVNVSGASLQRALGSLATFAGNVMVVFFLVFFLLMSGHHFRRRIIEIAGPYLERRKITAAIIDDINASVQRFLIVRLITSTVVAVATWAVLAWMQVPQAAVWGILAGVFNSIPYFGPVIVCGGLLVIGLVQSGDMMRALQMAGAALLITSLEGWLLTPPLMGKAERMNVLVVFLGVLLWTWVWGAWGTIVAVPMLVIVKAVADRLEPLKPVGRLMAP
jgi:predicted PurR-regulated permease PerM